MFKFKVFENLFRKEHIKYWPNSKAISGISQKSIFGNLNGPFRDFFENGNLRATGQYRHNREYGEFTTYRINGTIITVNNYNKNAAIDGLSLTYYDNGMIHEKINYKNGKKHGLYEEYFYGEKGTDPVKKTVANYKDDKLHGEYKEYFKNGYMERKSNYKNGKLNDQTAFYYENGSLKSRMSYKNNNLYGEYFDFDDKGNLLKQCFYINSKVHGTHYIRNDDKEESTYYDNGNEITKELYEIQERNKKLIKDYRDSICK